MKKTTFSLLLFPLLLAHTSSCRSRSQDIATNPVFQQASVNAFSARSDRDLMGLIAKYHAPLIQRNKALVDLKYQAMASSAFVFYRATAFLFYNDIASEKDLKAAISAPLQGDLHLENLGTYRTSQGEFGYDLNDFDEAVTGPFSWDLARLGVSIHLAASEVGLSAKDRQQLVVHFLKSYESALRTLQSQPQWYNIPLNEKYLTEKPAKEVTQARERFNRLAWLQEKAPGGRFPQDAKVHPVPAKEMTVLQQAVQTYVKSRPEGAAFFALKDTAMRIAGKGSLGRYRYITLMEGPTASPQDDIILEFKEAATPSARYAGVGSTTSEGARIVNAYRKFLPGVDPYLGVTHFGSLSAYVREWLPDEAVNLEKVNKAGEYREFLDTVALVIARAHSRNGKTMQLAQQASALAPSIATFADDYAKQVAADHKQFKAAF